MIQVDIRADLKQVSDALTAIEKQAIPAALTRALNKTATTVRTTATREMRKERPALLARTIREQMRIERAAKVKPVASVIVSGRPIPLRDFRARKTKAGVTVQVSQAGRKLVRHKGNKAFVVDRIGNHVFAREGKSRLPIKKLHGPSLPSTFVKERIANAMRTTAGDAFPKRIREEMAFELRRLGLRP